MLTAEEAWRVEQGERDLRAIAIPDTAEDFNLTDWTVDAVIRASHRAGATVLYTWPDDLITVVGDDVVLEIPAEVSLSWAFELGWYRVKLVPADEVAVQRVASGVFVLDAD